MVTISFAGTVGRMVGSGFKFGMLLQAAVGPVCVFIFQTAAEEGFFAGLLGVVGVAAADALYILASILGIGTLIEKRAGLKNALKLFGAAVMALFGLSFVLSVFHLSLLPSISLPDADRAGNALARAAVLTLSNPITIVFWTGVFSARAAKDGMGGKAMYLFGFGAVLSTLAFLTAVTAAGSLSGAFLPEAAVRALNGLVGLALIFFALKTAFSKTKASDDAGLPTDGNDG